MYDLIYRVPIYSVNLLVAINRPYKCTLDLTCRDRFHPIPTGARHLDL